MRSKALILALVSAALLSTAVCDTRVYAAPVLPRPNAAQAVTVDAFYQSLTPYGHWFSHDRLGWVWMPFDVAVNWRPYSVGQWVYSDYGWTWDSDEPWGWATYHYGRWQFDANYGWLWVTGAVWGPAWVSWRFGDGYCGWAPLPPVVGWDNGLILSGLDLDEYIPPFWYNFVEERYVAVPHLHDHLLPPARNVSLIGQTRNITRYELSANRIFNHAVDIDRIEKDTGHSINRYRVVDADSPTALRHTRARDGELSLYKPQVTQTTEGHAPRPPSSDRQAPNQTTTDLARQQEQERRRLEQQQNADREALRQQHRSEMAHPPKGMFPGDLNQRHQNEQREFEEQARRENQVLNHWHGMGRVGGVSPRGGRH